MFGDPSPRHYDAYTFTNNTGATQCVTVDPTTECVGTNYIFVAAYLGSFDPNNICANWIGDSGSSPDPTAPPVTFMNAGDGTPARYIECMEFFLAPYPIGGGQGDPTKAPDITINSWGCPASEGCSANTLQSAVEAQAAAGIMGFSSATR